MESAGSFVREGNVDGVMMVVRKREREDKSKLMVDVARELMRKEKGKQLNGKFLMELLRELEKEDLKVTWSFLEELARQLVRRLLHHIENSEKQSVEIAVMQIILDTQGLFGERRLSYLCTSLEGEIYRRIQQEIGMWTVVVEILVMELWRELVRNQKEKLARHLVRNIMRGLLKERKWRPVVELLQKVECEDQELLGELLKDVAREVVVKKQYSALGPGELLMEIVQMVNMKDKETMWEQKWALAFGVELAREDVGEHWWDVVICFLDISKYSMAMSIVRNLAIEQWRLGSNELKDLEWKQEWKLVMQLLWKLRCKVEKQSLTPHRCGLLRNMWHVVMKEMWKESGMEKWRGVMELVRELEMGPKYELAMQLLEELGEEFVSGLRWDFVMELVKEVFTEILTELSREFEMESLNRFVVMHYMEIMTPEKKWKGLRNVLWMFKEAKLGEDGEELVMELLEVYAGEVGRSRRVEQVLTEERSKELVKAFVRKIMSTLSRDQKLLHLWCFNSPLLNFDSPLLDFDYFDHWFFYVDESRVIRYLDVLVMTKRLNCEILWRLGMQHWKVPLARKLVTEKECKEVMNVVEALGMKRMWELAMEILGALLDWEEEKGSENVQLVRVFRKRQRDMRRKEEVKRKRSFRKFVDNKVVPRLCEICTTHTKQQVTKFLQRFRRMEFTTTYESQADKYHKALTNTLLECVYVDCDVFDESHVEIVAALYEGMFFIISPGQFIRHAGRTQDPCSSSSLSVWWFLKELQVPLHLETEYEV